MLDRFGCYPWRSFPLLMSVSAVTADRMVFGLCSLRILLALTPELVEGTFLFKLMNWCLIRIVLCHSYRHHASRTLLLDSERTSTTLRSSRPAVTPVSIDVMIGWLLDRPKRAPTLLLDLRHNLCITQPNHGGGPQGPFQCPDRCSGGAFYADCPAPQQRLVVEET